MKRILLILAMVALPFIAHSDSGIVFTAGGGGVIGPGSSTDDEIVRFDGVTGNIIKDAGVVTLDSAGVAGGFTAVGIGLPSPTTPFHLVPTGSGAHAFSGVFLRVDTGTFTDTATAMSGTAPLAIGHSIINPTFASTNTGVTINAAIGTAILGMPVAGANTTIGNAQILSVGDLTSVTPHDLTSTVSLGSVGISDGVGAVTDRTTLLIVPAGSISLGDQTATLTRWNLVNLGDTSLSSTTNTRTVTDAATLFIEGPPQDDGGGLVVFTNNPRSIFVEAGTSAFAGATAYVPGGIQSLLAAAAIDVSDNTFVQVVGSGGAVTLTSTPTIADGLEDGQMIIIAGTDDINTLKIQDDFNLAGSNLALSGNVDFTLARGDTIQLIFHTATGAWIEISRSDN